MKPYSKDNGEKYSEEDFDNGKKSKKKIRQEARDANRALKKSKRQELKRKLRNDLDNLD
jgi:hypothetical protein